MKKQEFIEHIQSLLGQAETGKALQQMVDWLDGEPRYRRLEDIALKIQQLHSKTQIDEEKGIISFDKIQLNNNIVTDSILKLLTDVENDNLNPKRYRVEKDQTARWQLWVSLATLALIATGIGFWALREPETNPSLAGTTILPPETEETCPEFVTTSLFNVLVMPFDNLSDGADRPHIPIINGIARKISDYNLSEKADVQQGPEESGFNVLKAAQKGSECNARLVMWGTTEQVGSEKLVRAEYKYIQPEGEQKGLDLTLLSLDDEGSNIESVTTISSIQPEGKLTQNVEWIIQAFFGLLSHQLGDAKDAIANLERVVADIDPRDSANLLVFSNMLASDYIKSGEYDKAIKVYDKLLASHPNYKLANINQGVLLYKNEQYAESIEKLNKAIEMDPDNARLIQMRGDAYLKNDQLRKAKKDYQNAKTKNPGNTNVINKKIQQVDTKIVQRSNISNASVNNLSATNSVQLRNLSEIINNQRSLENYDNAVRVAKKVLREKPDHYESHKVLIEHQLEVRKDTTRAREHFKRAIDKGAEKQQLYKDFPLFRPKMYQLDPSRFRTLQPEIRLN
ncbi:MAG: tetratricopeptide repeat protein [Bacteroidota bacterium]